MTSASGSRVGRARWRKRAGLLVALLFVTLAGLWLGFGPHRRAFDRLLDNAARQGLVCAGGNREAGLFSSSLRDVRVSVRGAPGIEAAIGHIEITHWPFRAPAVFIEGAKVDLRGDPVVLFGAITRVGHSPEARLSYRPLEVTYDHRLLGQVRLSGVTLDRREGVLEIQAARVQIGDLAWQDVRLFPKQRKAMLAIGFGAEPGQGRAQLACFPSTQGVARLILDVPHRPARPLVEKLGGDLGDGFDATQVAGSVSMDIPDDLAEPVRGRVQLVLDRWPTFTPGKAEPLLGSTFSLLSNIVPSTDGSYWLLPRVELTTLVFSLAGKGSIKLGRETRFQLEVEGERTCRQLRALLPPSQELKSVQQFLDSFKGKTASPVRLWLRWDTGGGKGLRPEWRFEPGCGLGPRPEGGA